MGYTLAEARTRARTDYLDDPDGDRWVDAEMDRHLKAAFGRVTDWFIRKGSQVFRSSSTQNAVAGEIDLSAVLPSKIVRVLAKSGNHHTVVPYVQLRDRVQSYTGTDEFVVHYDAVPAFPVVDGNALLDDVNTFPALEELIVLRSIESATVKDGEIPVGFVSLMRRLEKDVLMNMGVKRVEKFPRPAGQRGLSWSYDYSTQSVVLSYNAS